MILMNVQSLLPKIEQLQIVASLKSPHAICIAETWLNETINSLLIHVPNYSIRRYAVQIDAIGEEAVQLFWNY